MLTFVLLQVFPNSTPAGLHSLARPRPPAPVPIVNRSSSRSFRVAAAQAYSPSLGDDPWLRFM